MAVEGRGEVRFLNFFRRRLLQVRRFLQSNRNVRTPPEIAITFDCTLRLLTNQGDRCRNDFQHLLIGSPVFDRNTDGTGQLRSHQ